jgi:transcription elongation factor Elf1
VWTFLQIDCKKCGFKTKDDVTEVTLKLDLRSIVFKNGKNRCQHKKGVVVNKCYYPTREEAVEALSIERTKGRGIWDDIVGDDLVGRHAIIPCKKCGVKLRSARWYVDKRSGEGYFRVTHCGVHTQIGRRILQLSPGNKGYIDVKMCDT